MFLPSPQRTGTSFDRFSKDKRSFSKSTNAGSNVPKFDELGVNHIFPKFKADPAVM